MKKFIALIVSLTFIFGACKKSDEVDKKDYLSMIKDKIWTVGIAVPGNPTQYSCFRFNADGTMVASFTFIDRTSYTWQLDGKHLSLQLDGTKVEGDFTDDNKFVLTKATPALPYTFVMTGELNPDADLVLENTKWNSTATAHGSTATVGLSLYFSPGLVLDVPSPDPKILIMNQHYARVGASVRCIVSGPTKDTYYFGVIMPGGKEIRGSIEDADSTIYNWQVTIQ